MKNFLLNLVFENPWTVFTQNGYQVRKRFNSDTLNMEYQYRITPTHTHVPGVNNHNIIPYWSKFCPWEGLDSLGEV